jgi:anti-sigma regulatory factor (Ser/Thr protein kinase)
VIVKDAAYFRTQGARCLRFARQVKYTHPDMARALTALAEEFDNEAVRASGSDDHKKEGNRQKSG